MAWQRKRISIPDDFKPGERKELGEQIVEFIKKRSDQGRGVKNGRNFKFPKYSESYKKSKAYKDAGKSGGVNLKLKDEMLEDMEVISHKKGSILIGYKNGTESNDKAEGNQKGTYGQPSPIPGKARPFIDITQGDLKKLVKKYS